MSPYRDPPPRVLRPCSCRLFPDWYGGKIVEASWTCCSCGVTLGAHLTFCSSCGHARNLYEGEPEPLLAELGLGPRHPHQDVHEVVGDFVSPWDVITPGR